MSENVIHIDACRAWRGLHGAYGNEGRRGSLRQQSLVAVAQNRMDAGKGGHFPGRALRIATCHQDAGGWILTM
jgi:hypothetical protein